MSEKEVWLVTGAGRGLGTEIAMAALEAGHYLVATSNGKQPGDPAKLAQALIKIASETTPPRRFVAGADAIATAEQVATTLQEQLNAYRDLSSSLAHDASSLD